MRYLLVLAFAALLSAQSATRNVVLSWTASTSSGVTGYNVYRATATAGPFTLLTTAPVAATTYTDSGTVGSTYTYQVTAVTSPCTPTTPATQPCGESAPATASSTVPPKPIATATITVVVP